MLLKLFFLVTLLLRTGSTNTALREGNEVVDERVQKIEEYAAYLDRNDIAMGTISFSENGVNLLHTQVGLVVPGLASDEFTQYRVGSITKMFTAVMILQLVESGELTLESTLAAFFPNVTNAEIITIEHMLRHRSGLFSITSDSTYPSWFQQAQTRQDMLARIESYEPVFEPDTKTEYSNTNFILLGYIIEDITMTDYATLLQEQVSIPCELNRTAYMTPASADDNVAASFVGINDLWETVPETHPSVPGGAGAIMSTALDLTIFAQCLFMYKLLNETTLGDMLRLVDSFGLGVYESVYDGTTGYGHEGGIDSFQSLMFYFPEKNITVAVIKNGASLTFFGKNIISNFVQIVLDPESFEVPAPSNSGGTRLMLLWQWAMTVFITASFVSSVG